MDVDAKPAARGRGRPRDPTLDARILEQVLALLGSRGYAGLTLDDLAERTGVAKTTILRRWPSKAAVAAAAVERLALQSVDVPPSDTLRDDLHAYWPTPSACSRKAKPASSHASCANPGTTRRSPTCCTP